jgi:hypothetical protein
MTEAEMRQLSKWICEIFFGGRIPGLKVRWKRNPKAPGRTYCGPIVPLILPIKICINPLKTHEVDHGRFIFLNIIGTLVHELIHAVLHCCYKSCTTCGREDTNSDGHGRAFQLLGAKLEEAFPRLLGLPLRLARWESLIDRWEKLKPLPSPHDMATFQLERLNDVSVEVGDIRRLVEDTDLLFQYMPRQCMGAEATTLGLAGIEKLPQRHLYRGEIGKWTMDCIVDEELSTDEGKQVKMIWPAASTFLCHVTFLFQIRWVTYSRRYPRFKDQRR